MKCSLLQLAIFAALAACLMGTRGGLNAQESVGESSHAFRPSMTSRDETDENARRRLREGTTLSNRGGHFKQDGDGAIFVTEDDLELVALPNLNLERVVRTLKGSDEAESIRWSVNGVVTEFNGRNFLLISRAVYKSASPPPAPEQILN